MDGGLMTLIGQALAQPMPDAADRTMQRILDGALAEAAAHGFQGLTLEGVARRAGVNRITIYRRFGDRDALLAAVTAREGHRMAQSLSAAVTDVDDPDERLVQGFIAAFRLAREHPIVVRATTIEPESLIAAGLADDGMLLRIGSAFMAQAIRQSQAQGRALHLDADAAGQVAARLFAAYVLFPGAGADLHDDAAVEAYARTTFLPLLHGPRTDA